MSTPHNPAPADLDWDLAEWEKSGYSDNQGQGDCVKYTKTFVRSHGVVGVGDTKTPDAHLVFPATSWAAFAAAVGAGEFGEV